MLVVGETLQVGFRATENNRVTECSGGGDIVNNILFRHAPKIVVEALQIGFLGERQTLQIRDGLDRRRVNAPFLEHALIEW